ncbi:hypothetical protein [Archangium sp.]|uniref:hypothetical protein n=1 Tax=Archangium sp. TaxID=1872627 RepID=UPI003899F7C3
MLDGSIRLYIEVNVTKSRRRGPSGASIIGAIFVIGLMARLLSLIWLYLVIGGALALLGWMAVVLARRARATPSPSQPVPVGAPGPTPLPSDQFRSLVPIDPTVFDDPAQAKAAAIKTFVTWARQLPMAPENPSDLVRSLELRVQYTGRLATTIAERKVVAREAPHRGTSPTTSSQLAPDAVDPWAFSPETLRSASLYVAPCTPCTGAGKVPCSTCRGTLSTTCLSCNGTRKAYGYASNGSRRLMNCKQCNAKGEIKCTACTEGRVTCQTCRETGRMEHWLEFLETSRSVVQVALDSDKLRAFRWSTAGPQASPTEIEADAKPLGEIAAHGALDEEKVAEIVPRAWIQANWRALQPGLRPGERIQSQTLRFYEIPSVQLSYSVADGPPTVIGFEGRRMLAPPASVDQQFEARAQKIRLARAALLVLGAGVPLAYLVRGSYFWNGWVGALTVCVVGAAAAGERFVREATLGREGARRWAAAVAATVMLACGMAVGAEPSLRAAQRHLSEGHLEKTRMELAALGEPDKEAHAQAWAALHLAYALRSNDVGTVASEAAQIPKGLPQREPAEQRLYELTRLTVQQQLAKKDLGTAQATLAQATPVLQGDAKEKPFGRDLAELSAQAKDAEFAECATDACRWRAASEAARAMPSEERKQRLIAARARIVEGLTPQPRAGEPAQSRLQRLDEVATLAKAISEMPGDEDLSAKARAAATWTRDERRKIPLVGAERAVAAELLGIPASTGTDILSTERSPVAVYCAMKGGRCAGVYLVGSTKGARVLNDSAHAAATTELLSQALGHPTSLPSPPSTVSGKALTLTRWNDGGVTVVARWRDSSLMELRIGDAKP